MQKNKDNSLHISQAAASLDKNEVKRILVCQLRQIGDVLLTTPSIELLSRRFPDAKIDVFTEKKCLPMLENNPHINRLWALDKKNLPTLLHELRFYAQIAGEGYDIVVDFQQLPRCRWVVAFSRAKVRLSFPPPWYLRPLYTDWNRPEPAYAGAYKAGVLAPLEIHWNGEAPRLYLSGEEEAEAGSLLKDMQLAQKTFIAVDATHKHATRRWPARHYARLLDMFAAEFADLHFFLPFGPGEEGDVHLLRDLCVYKERVHIPMRMLSLRQMAACTARATMQIGNCSSPRHMAVALGIPTLTILGSTSPGWTFPSPQHITLRAKDFMSMPCQNCNSNTCSTGIVCLEQLSPEMIYPTARTHFLSYGLSRSDG